MVRDVEERQPALYACVDEAPSSALLSCGEQGEYVDSPSPFCTASLDEDKKAFAALMNHLKEVDSERNVLMVQVENETGTWAELSAITRRKQTSSFRGQSRRRS